MFDFESFFPFLLASSCSVIILIALFFKTSILSKGIETIPLTDSNVVNCLTPFDPAQDTASMVKKLACNLIAQYESNAHLIVTSSEVPTATTTTIPTPNTESITSTMPQTNHLPSNVYLSTLIPIIFTSIAFMTLYWIVFTWTTSQHSHYTLMANSLDKMIDSKIEKQPSKAFSVSTSDQSTVVDSTTCLPDAETTTELSKKLASLQTEVALLRKEVELKVATGIFRSVSKIDSPKSTLQPNKSTATIISTLSSCDNDDKARCAINSVRSYSGTSPSSLSPPDFILSSSSPSDIGSASPEIVLNSADANKDNNDKKNVMGSNTSPVEPSIASTTLNAAKFPFNTCNSAGVSGSSAQGISSLGGLKNVNPFLYQSSSGGSAPAFASTSISSVPFSQRNRSTNTIHYSPSFSKSAYSKNTSGNQESYRPLQFRNNKVIYRTGLGYRSNREKNDNTSPGLISTIKKSTVSKIDASKKEKPIVSAATNLASAAPVSSVSSSASISSANGNDSAVSVSTNETSAPTSNLTLSSINITKNIDNTASPGLRGYGSTPDSAPVISSKTDTSRQKILKTEFGSFDISTTFGRQQWVLAMNRYNAEKITSPSIVPIASQKSSTQLNVNHKKFAPVEQYGKASSGESPDSCESAKIEFIIPINTRVNAVSTLSNVLKPLNPVCLYGKQQQINSEQNSGNKENSVPSSDASNSPVGSSNLSLTGSISDLKSKCVLNSDESSLKENSAVTTTAVAPTTTTVSSGENGSRALSSELPRVVLTLEEIKAKLEESEKKNYRRLFIPGRGWVSAKKLQEEASVLEAENGFASKPSQSIAVA